MELTFEQIDEITSTFVVGYYALRNIPVTLDRYCETSRYDILEDKVVVSYKSISKALKNLSLDSEPYEAIRRPFYHEIAHAMLSPTGLYVTSHFNIFEDQRIETILDTHFMNLTFHKVLELYHPYAEDGGDPELALYNIIRHGKCSKPGYEKFVKMRNEIIKKYRDVH